MPFTDEVITIAPSWQVITFENLRKAKLILLEKYHSRIIISPQELAKRYTLEDLKNMYIKTLGMIKEGSPWHNFNAMTSKEKVSEYLWPKLISYGRLTTKLAFHKNTVNPNLPTHTTYFSNFVLGKDPIRDTHYYKLPLQAKKIVDMIQIKVTPAGTNGIPEFMFMKLIGEIDLKTVQGNRAIWTYYKSLLQAEGFIEIYKQPTKRS